MATDLEVIEVSERTPHDPAPPEAEAVPEHVVEWRLSARDFDIVVNAINSNKPTTKLFSLTKTIVSIAAITQERAGQQP